MTRPFSTDMGNFIQIKKAGPDAYLKLSNGGTGVLLSVLLLSGSDLAVSKWEKQLIIWLGEHDQSIFGSGVVGFDLDEIAWTVEDFAAQKAFLVRVIDTALTRHRWDALNYDPPFVHEYLGKLRELVEKYLPEYVQPGKKWEWRIEPEAERLCPVHKVYMHEEGCLICNDG